MKIHEYQREILKQLVTRDGLRFNELLIVGLESEHLNYHLQKVVEIGLAAKSGPKYVLTDAGKDYMNLFDDALEHIERLPKVSVIVSIARYNKQKQCIENLLSRRLRHPYFGKVGRIGGKVQFGEPAIEAAQRELREETGLTATNLVMENSYRKIRKREDGTPVQDVIWYTFFTTHVTGKLIKQTEFQENFWATEEETRGMDVYDDFTFKSDLKPQKPTFIEHIGIAEGY